MTITIKLIIITFGIVFTVSEDPIRDDLWQASIECSDDAITIQVQQTGDRSSIAYEFYREVRIQCTDRNNKVGRPNNNYNDCESV